MKTVRSFLLILVGVTAVFFLSGCGQQKYKLNYDGYGFESKRTEYAAGEKVTVYYNLIATDTDYNFFIDDDVNMKESYDNDHGYIFTFTMPDHDVTIHEEDYNSMEYIPEPVEIIPVPEDEIAAELDESAFLFDYFREVTATVGGDGYDELVLYKRPNGDDLILAKYSKWGSVSERRRLCIVPEAVLDDCLEAVVRYGMSSWKDGFPITGARYVVKYKDGEDLIRITSDEMPEDGMAAFDEIGSILGAAWSEFGSKESADDQSAIPPDGGLIPFDPDQPDSATEPEPGNSEDSWFCPNCGRKNDGSFCAECGEKKPGQETEAPAPAAEIPPSQASDRNQQSASELFTGVMGTEFLVPEGFIQLDESPNIGYQYTFWHPDYEIRIEVTEIAPGYLPEDAWETDYQNASNNPDTTYFKEGENWFVESGYHNNGEEIFYAKESSTDGVLKSFRITYPTAKRETGDSITAEFEKNCRF